MTLSAKDIQVTYGRRKILNGVNFDAPAGTVSVIVGPNGSGKTTLLKAMTGDVPSKGTVILNGQDTTKMPGWQLASQRAVLPQSLSVAFTFTVAEIVRMGLLSGVDAADSTLPGRALDAVGLSTYGPRFYHELSGGEQQRVQMARVLTQVWHPVQDGAPRWLFLDEPVSSLDIGHQLTLIRLMRDYAERGGGVIAVMHDLNLTAMCADRVTVMADGQVIASGAVDSVLTNEVLARAYGCPLQVNAIPTNATHFVLPQSAHA
ncbi:MAG: heme ABC transporter ATP-binding protein [Pseudomonadota bacterium]